MVSWRETIYKFPEIIEPVLVKYNLKWKVIFEREIIFYGNGFVLNGVLEQHGLSLIYYRKKDADTVYLYKIDNYFARLIDDKDRVNILPRNHENKFINDMIITTNSLMNKWDNMLSGKLDWIEDLNGRLRK